MKCLRRWSHCVFFTLLSLISAPVAFAAAAPPYPPSPVIKEIVWAPATTIARAAFDSDNWPVTWADDDAIYTTYGDGTGFVPKTDIKLSCGFARITGAPTDFKGVNIRSPAEQIGQGKVRMKGWGILSVEGVLYLWFGNANKKGGTARLAWSSDHARTWTFADWTWPEFGQMGFVNARAATREPPAALRSTMRRSRGARGPRCISRRSGMSVPANMVISPPSG